MIALIIFLIIFAILGFLIMVFMMGANITKDAINKSLGYDDYKEM